jgi:ribosome-associated protein
MIEINSSLSLDENEIGLEFIRSSGPGGQHVNRSATAVQLRFNVLESPSLPDTVRQRLLKLAKNRINSEGFLILTAEEHRSQTRNREAVIERLVELIRMAAQKPRPRRKTKPSRAAKMRRLEEKRRRGEIKKRRRSVKNDLD